MRIIAGTHKGRMLKTVADLTVRPATGKVRGAIFNILQSRIDLQKARILDLFAGSGSLGIEALSRGAQYAVFVENSKPTARYLRQNIASVHEEQRCEVLETDVFRFLRTAQGLFDLIFVDPPYTSEDLPQLASAVFQRGIVSKNGYVVIEHPTDVVYTSHSLWEKVVEKKYGRTLVTFFKHHQAEQPA
jgi:16S rRNA (guanine966-N2)-methyltransferase